MKIKSIKNIILDLFKNLPPIQLRTAIKKIKIERENNVSFFRMEHLFASIEKKNLDTFNLSEKLLYGEIEYRIANINKEELIDIINTAFDKEKILTHSKNLEKFLDIFTQLDKTLSPLKALDMSWGLDLIGGAVRDLVMDNSEKIKDLDILITLNKIPTYKEVHFTKKNLSQYYNFTEQELNDVDFNDSDKIAIRQAKLVNILISREQSLDETHYFDLIKHSATGYGFNLVQTLAGITKINNTNAYPLDILITNENRDAFFDSMDLNICKVGLCFKDRQSESLKELPSLSSLPSRLYAKISFFEDLKDKKITIDVRAKTEEQLEYTFNIHLPKVKAKYDYPLTIEKLPYNRGYELIEQKAEIFLSYYEMNKKLPSKVSAEKRKKI